MGSTGATGATGAKGDKGDKGDTGATGSQGTTGVVTIGVFNGAISTTIPGGATAYVFAGPTATVTTTTGQRLTGAASLAIGLSAAGPQRVSIGLCYQPNAGGTIVNFAPGSTYMDIQLTSLRTSQSISASVVPPSAGTWKVGACVLNDVSGAVAINNNDVVNGWVQVTN